MTVTTRDGRHAIAERNTEAIVTAALRVLGEDPTAGLSDVAAAAGVGRATVYRHFPSRAALLEELHSRAAAHLAEVVKAASVAGKDDLREGLLVLVTGLGELVDRYAATIPDEPSARERRARVAYAPLIEMVRKERDAGRLRATVDPEWFVSALRGLLTAALEGPAAWRPPRAEVPELVVDTLLNGLSGP